jgi:hypothetical protein
MKTLFVAALSLALFACAGSAPRIDPARVSALHKGQTTVDEVVRQFGRPSVLSKNVDGTQSAFYLHGNDGQSGTAMVSLLASNSVDSTTFYFDTKGVLTDYKITQAAKSAPAEAAKAAPAEAAKPLTTDTAKAAPAESTKPGATQATTSKTAPAAPANTQATIAKPAPAAPTSAQGTLTKPAPSEADKFFPGASKENR